MIAEYVNGAAVGSPTREYIYSGSALLATIEGGATKYHQRDHLSIRLNTDSTGAVIGQQGNYPYGEAWYSASTTTKWRFTTYERDSETANDYAVFRYYVNRLGRFETPDPIAGSVIDPQSLNRYAYARNDPVNLTDPLGLLPKCSEHLPERYRSGGMCVEESAFRSFFLGTYYGGCYVEGMSASCELVYRMVEHGTAAPCPNNDCTNVQYTNEGLLERALVRLRQWRVDIDITGDCDVLTQPCATLRTYWVYKWLWVLVPPGPPPQRPRRPLDRLPPLDFTVVVSPGALTFAKVPGKWCVGVGAGVAAGVSPGGFTSGGGGPLLTGDTSNAENIISGWSWSGSAQILPWLGSQAIWNSNGSVGGPTGGTPGLSLTYTYTVCF